jgi:hypothetical protein
MSRTVRTVSVEFVDAATGQTFARSDLPADQLPHSFASETTLHLGDDPWLVERAEPVVATEFVPAGRLVLTVRRLASVPPQEILYSLPTICDTLPRLGPTPTAADCLELHEDDWRQVELVSRSLATAVNAELDAILRVHEQYAERDSDERIVGFRKVHIRSIVPFAEPVSWSRLRELLPTPQQEYEGVRFRGSAQVAVGSFALDVGRLSWYGITERDAMAVLGVAFTAAGDPVAAGCIEPVLREFDLVLIDWCRCAAISPDNLTHYLRAVGRL